MVCVAKRGSLKNWEGVIFVTDPTWGDNGKGKLIDLLAQRADLIIRTNGGPNAGHTVINGYGEFKLHLVPSGIFNPRAISVLADTVVINPLMLVGEIEYLRSAGVKITEKNLLVSPDAHLIMPWHSKRDGLNEVARGKGKIGTTGQGIGPTYGDRVERTGLRVRDLISADFEEKFNQEFRWQQKLIALMSGAKRPFDRKEILKAMQKAARVITPMVRPVIPVIYDYYEAGKRILGEPGQGVLLDLDRGGYPYVTSSHPGIAGFNLATGLSPKEVGKVIAVTKAYTTRVGEGPLPTEQNNEIGEKIRQTGGEFGATTGRPRRCGWLDIPAIRYGARVGGAGALAITKLDVFDNFPEIKICIGYKLKNKVYSMTPGADIQFMSQVTPIYETLKGWQSDTSKITHFSQLPREAQKYIERIEEVAQLPIELVSVGPHRKQTILL